MKRLAVNKRAVARLTLKEILNFTNMTEKRAFELANVHRTTWERWKSGDAYPHPAVIELIRLHAHGAIMPLAMQKAGCQFHGDALYDDYGNPHTLGELRVHRLYRQAFFTLNAPRSHPMLTVKEEGAPLLEAPLSGLLISVSDSPEN